MRKHIVIVSPAYGGAEKRFFDIFTALKRRGENIFYVAPSMLIDRLKADHAERVDAFDSLIPLEMAEWSPRRFVWEFMKLLRTLPRPSLFHYPMNCLWPLHAFRKDVLSLSLVDCTKKPRITARDRHCLLAYIALLAVRKIDVLSPWVFEELRDRPVGRKATLTPGGSFILPPTSIETSKKPVVAFFSRLNEDKGTLDFLHLVPALWKALRGRVPTGFRLKIAGYGPLESQVAATVKTLQAQDVPIDFDGYQSADDATRRSAVLLSLQRTTNYPSRVVAEALMAGCAVVIRDSGDSRTFGNLPGLAYCDDDLDVDELSATIVSLLEQVHQNEGFCRNIHTRAVERFYSNDYLDYFNDVVLRADDAEPGDRLVAR